MDRTDRKIKDIRRAVPSARERILDAAYELFSHRGVGAVGVDTVIARSCTAKMSLYRHFQSKEELVLAFLGQRASQWTRQWLAESIRQRAEEPEARLLAIFDLFDEWFQEPSFEGCSFINVLLESPPESSVRLAAAAHLAEIRELLAGLAAEAGLSETERFARTWHFLMKGSIITAQEGHREAAREARQAGEVILRNWPRPAPS